MIYWALISLVQFGSALAVMARSEPSQFGYLFVTLIEIVVSFALLLGMAWLLLARTEWVADKLRVQDEKDVAELEGHPVLPVGVQLIGVYVTVYAIPSFARTLLEPLRMYQDHFAWYPWSKIIIAAIQLGLGIFLMLWSNKVVELITRKKHQTQPGDGNCDA